MAITKIRGARRLTVAKPYATSSQELPPLLAQPFHALTQIATGLKAPVRDLVNGMRVGVAGVMPGPTASHRVLSEGALAEEDAGMTPPDRQELPLAVCRLERPVLCL